jgi:hypothetical protein
MHRSLHIAFYQQMQNRAEVMRLTGERWESQPISLILRRMAGTGWARKVGALAAVPSKIVGYVSEVLQKAKVGHDISF